MTIRAKVIGYFLVVFLLFVGISGYIISRQRQANARLQSINGFFLPLSRELASLQHNVNRPKRLQKKIAQIETLLMKGKTARVDRVDELLTLLGTVRGTLTEIEGITQKELFEPALERLRADIRNIAQLVDQLAQRITGDAQSEGQQSIFIGLALSLILGCLAVVTLMVSYNALKPLRDLIDSVRKIGDGDFNQSLKVSTGANDELSILAREYNRALAALADRDVKIQKQQSEILQTERLAAVGQLSAEVVHEIRNPLNAISLNIDWMQHELQGTGQEISQVLQSISREIERLHQITECYLVRARVPSREGQKAAVNEAIKEVIEFCGEEDRARSIAVEMLLTDEEFYIPTDKSRFKQALINILKNAKEAMPRGGKIQIRTEFQNNAYRIQVKDSGSGMNASTRHHSFRPFFTTKPNGTGLGLSVTKSIVEEAHGSIQCESRLGDGTTVTLQFPC